MDDEEEMIEQFILREFSGDLSSASIGQIAGRVHGKFGIKEREFKETIGIINKSISKIRSQ